MGLLKIATLPMAEGFSQAWNYNGVAIVLDKVSQQFAVDFANMVITSFLQEQQKKAAAAAELKKIKVVEG